MSLHHEVTVILKHQNIISMFCIWIGFKNNFSLIQCLPFEKKNLKHIHQKCFLSIVVCLSL